MCSLYERINSLCKEKGVSCSRMCLDLGLSKSTVSDLKAGRTKGVSTNTAQKIASYFDVSVGYLLGEESEQKEKPIANSDELNKNYSENHNILLDYVKGLNEDEAAIALRLLKTVLGDD